MKPARDRRQRTCLVTAVASVTERDPATVPNFIRQRGVDWRVAVDRWARGEGFRVEHCDFDDRPFVDDLISGPWRGYWVACVEGRTRRANRVHYHAVVMRGRRIVHDNGGLADYHRSTLRLYHGFRFER